MTLMIEEFPQRCTRIKTKQEAIERDQQEEKVIRLHMKHKESDTE